MNENDTPDEWREWWETHTLAGASARLNRECRELFVEPVKRALIPVAIAMTLTLARFIQWWDRP